MSAIRIATRNCPKKQFSQPTTMPRQVDLFDDPCFRGMGSFLDMSKLFTCKRALTRETRREEATPAEIADDVPDFASVEDSDDEESCRVKKEKLIRAGELWNGYYPDEDASAVKSDDMLHVVPTRPTDCDSEASGSSSSPTSSSPTRRKVHFSDCLVKSVHLLEDEDRINTWYNDQKRFETARSRFEEVSRPIFDIAHREKVFKKLHGSDDRV